jgi:hypothetical protein
LDEQGYVHKCFLNGLPIAGCGEVEEAGLLVKHTGTQNPLPFLEVLQTPKVIDQVYEG